MPENAWPVDCLGNPIRKGNMLYLTLGKPALFFRVVDVSPAGTLSGPDGRPLALRGRITLQAIMNVDYEPGAAITDAVVTREPETQPTASPVGASKETTQ